MKKLVLFLSMLSITNSSDVIGFCDIKGSVEKPGVYEISERDTINDVIIKAGGLKKDAYTDNINLSKFVKDEMVIYINNSDEISKIKELNNCICEPILKYTECDVNISVTNPNSKDSIHDPVTYDSIDKTSSTTKIVTEPTTSKLIVETTIKVTSTNQTTDTIKININIADLNDLIKLDGLGESKAKNIIEYRKINGSFKSIEELLNVDGIGKKTFESIKDFITI